MERFEGASTVRLKGPHGKYLWADEDHFAITQKDEARHEQALWTVDRSNNSGSRAKTLRLKSCFDSYLTACDFHYHGLSFLGLSGKRAAQMRPENVESPAGFDWEPVIDRGKLKLKSGFGTFLRANPSKPPWSNAVSHDIPRHLEHEDWLVWEIETVRAARVIPLEPAVGPLDDR